MLSMSSVIFRNLDAADKRRSIAGGIACAGVVAVYIVLLAALASISPTLAVAALFLSSLGVVFGALYKALCG